MILYIIYHYLSTFAKNCAKQMVLASPKIQYLNIAKHVQNVLVNRIDQIAWRSRSAEPSGIQFEHRSNSPCLANQKWKCHSSCAHTKWHGTWGETAYELDDRILVLSRCCKMHHMHTKSHSQPRLPSAVRTRKPADYYSKFNSRTMWTPTWIG